MSNHDAIKTWPLEPGYSLLREPVSPGRHHWWIQDDETGQWRGLSTVGRLFGYHSATTYSRAQQVIHGTRAPGDLFAGKIKPSKGRMPVSWATAVEVGWLPPERHPAPFPGFIPQQPGL